MCKYCIVYLSVGQQVDDEYDVVGTNNGGWQQDDAPTGAGEKSAIGESSRVLGPVQGSLSVTCHPLVLLALQTFSLLYVAVHCDRS